MHLESKSVTTSKSSSEIFNFLLELENYEQLMPENTEKFEVDNGSFIFGLKGMPAIRLVLKENTPTSNVTLGAASSKMPFTLAININAISEASSEVQIIFDGDFNPMITMMAKKPLTNFIEAVISNIEKL